MNHETRWRREEKGREERENKNTTPHSAFLPSTSATTSLLTETIGSYIQSQIR